MGSRTGSADLPLHGGHVPAWLASRMARLGCVLVEAIALEYGRDEVIRRLSHPFWFQSLGAVMGMDWHSSGITTSVLGALKRGLAPVEWELGLHVCGGRGKHSRRTPAELASVGERTGLDADALARASRLVAKVDSAAVQDGFDLYLHGFVVTDEGAWTVVQQGMNAASRQARRYHWLSDHLSSFIDEPHAAIHGAPSGTIVNLCDRRAARSRDSQLEIVRQGPDLAVRELSRMRNLAPATAPLPHLAMPSHHEVTAGDVVLRRLHGALAAAAERGPVDFADLLLTPGVGARTVLALASVAEVLHGAPCRFSDPARFSFAHGGKDGHPFPVPLRVYDETLRVMREAVTRAKLGQDDRLSALRKLDAESRRLESVASGPSFDDFVERERESSFLYGGMSVYGRARSPARTSKEKSKQQLKLPGLA
jgi:hypothetical protein